MEAEEKKQKAGARGRILARCPACKGAGKVAKTLPFRANPKAPRALVDRTSWRPCPRCKGTGQVGVR